MEFKPDMVTDKPAKFMKMNNNLKNAGKVKGDTEYNVNYIPKKDEYDGFTNIVFDNLKDSKNLKF